MQVRNLLIAAGVALAGVTTIAAVPAVADAQGFGYRPAYRAEAYRIERAREIRRIELLRARERERLAELRFHHRHEFRRF
jgi:hypothetical protein